MGPAATLFCPSSCICALIRGPFRYDRSKRVERLERFKRLEPSSSTGLERPHSQFRRALRQILQSDRTAQLAQSRDKIIVLILACLRVECAPNPFEAKVLPMCPE